MLFWCAFFFPFFFFFEATWFKEGHLLTGSPFQGYGYCVKCPDGLSQYFELENVGRKGMRCVSVGMLFCGVKCTNRSVSDGGLCVNLHTCICCYVFQMTVQLFVIFSIHVNIKIYICIIMLMPSCRSTGLLLDLYCRILSLSLSLSFITVSLRPVELSSKPLLPLHQSSLPLLFFICFCFALCTLKCDWVLHKIKCCVIVHTRCCLVPMTTRAIRGLQSNNQQSFSVFF